MNSLTKKRMIEIYIIFIIIFSSVDLSSALEASDIVNFDVNIDKEDPKDFEDIAIFVDSYDPAVIETTFIEKKDYLTRLSLSGIVINPTVDITKIRSIRIAPSDANSRRLIGSPIHVAPPNRRYTLSNLGLVLIPLKKIPREDDVPKRIDVNLTAYIDLDVSGLFGLFETDLILKQQNEDEWFINKEESAFLGGGGYVRINKIQENSIELVVYDDVYQDVTRQKDDPSDLSLRSRKQTIRLNVGENSHIIPLREDVFIRDLLQDRRLSFRDRIRIKLNDIRSIGKYAELTLIIDGIPSKKKVYEGSAIYEGSSWKVKSISVLGDKQIVEISDGRDTKEITRKLKSTTSGILQTQSAQVTPSEEIPDPLLAVVEDLSKRLDLAISLRSDGEILNVRNKLLDIYRQNYNNFQSSRKARDLLSLIVKYYSDNNADRKYDIEINYLARELSYIDNLNAQLSKEEDTITQQVDPSRDYYNKAVEDFNVVVDSFASSEFAPRALLEAARTRSLMGDTDGAVSYYNRYLLEYSNLPEVEANRRQIEFIISELLNDQSYEITQANIFESGKRIDIKISGVRVAQDSSKAYVTIQDDKGNLVPANQPVILSSGSEVFSDETSVSQKWYVKEILSDRIMVYRVVENNIIDQRPIYLNRDASILQSQNGARKVAVNKIDYSSTKEAYLTVMPAEERVVSKSDFSAHFIVEKRAFDLTPKQIENHIKTTKSLISKFDSAIDALDKIHKVWTTWCYGVFTTLWIKNLITSFGGRNLARKTVMEKWNQICDYNTYKPQDPKLKKDAATDECIRLNSKQIQDEINKANDAVSKVDEDIKKIESGEDRRFDGLNLKENKDLLRDHLLKENLARELKTKDYIDRYLSSQILIERQRIASSYADIEDNNEKIKEALAIKGISFEEYNLRNDIEKKQILEDALQSTIEHKTNLYILSLPSRLDSMPIYDSVDSDLLKNSVSNIVNAKFSITSLKDNTGSKGEVFAGDIKEYTKDGKQLRVVIIGGATHVLEKEIDSTNKPTGREYYIDNGQPVFIEPKQNLEVRVDQKSSGYKPEINVVEAGRHQGLLYRMTIDDIEYIEINPDTGRTSSGSIQKIGLWKRVKPNTALGSPTDLSLGEFPPEEFRQRYPKAYNSLVLVNNQIQSGRRLDSGSSIRVSDPAGGVVNYVVGKEVAKRTEASCYDFMDPNDCLFLFGACDPIMCPTSRFNRGGNYYVDNVVATGIFGSIFLGADTLFDPAHGEILPVCLTGINAGAKNYKSILQGYVQCLEQKRDKGLSVGVCDRIRNIGICSVVWREAVAILNVDGGGLGILSNKILDKGKGGGEYAFFKEGIKNNLDYAKFFTSQYASNVFAAYRSDTVGEIGAEICQSAIYGRIPGTGNIIERLSRPSGPAQFTAILDEVPREAIARGDFVSRRDSISDYQIYYHIYAGDQSDVRYSVELRGEGLPPRSISGIRILKAGDFVDQNEPITTYSGYNQICIQVNGNTECGFGIVSTDYGINKLKDNYVQSQAQKTDITSERQCVPEAGLISSASGPVSAAAGVFSSGLVQTQVVRKCSGENPGVRDGTSSFWVEVGVCGKDEVGRDLGKCYLDTRSSEHLLRDKQSQEELDVFLQEQRQKEFELLTKTQIDALLKKADDIIDQAKSDEQKLAKEISTLNKEKIDIALATIEKKYKEALDVYNEIIEKGTLEQELLAQAYFERAMTYQSLGLLLSRLKELPKEKIEILPNVCKKQTDSTWLCENARENVQYSLEGVVGVAVMPRDISVEFDFTRLPTQVSAKFDVFQNGIKVDCDVWFYEKIQKVFTHYGAISISGDKQVAEKVHYCEAENLKNFGVSLLYDQTAVINYNKDSGLVSFRVHYVTVTIPSTLDIGPFDLKKIQELKNRLYQGQTYQQIIEEAINEPFYNPVNKISRMTQDELKEFKSVVTPNLIFGIMWTESSGNVNAGKDSDACNGLMGVCDGKNGITDAGIPNNQLFDPKQNIIAGVRTLKQKYAVFDSITDPQERLKFAILAYNVGEGPVKSIIVQTGNSIPSFDEALTYLDTSDLVEYKASERERKLRVEALPYVKKVLAYKFDFDEYDKELLRTLHLTDETTQYIQDNENEGSVDSIVPPSFVPPIIPETPGLGGSFPEK